MKRDFPLHCTIRDGQMYRTCKITCGECGHVGDIGNQSFGTKRANELAPRKFRERGWLVGRRPADDRCPLHNPRLKNAEPEINAPEETEMPNDDTTPLAAEPPRTMSFIDRRVILTKIEEVYIDEKTGYASGWSDRKVATDLNVPQAWVAELREQNFGPAINEDFVELLAEMKDLRTRFANWEDSKQAVLDFFEKQEAFRNGFIDGFNNGCKSVKAKMAELEKKFEKLAP